MNKLIKRVTIQKENTRYVFDDEVGSDGKHYYFVTTWQCMSTGAGVHQSATTKERGNALYQKSIRDGFKRFRNEREVSWYATRENNTGYPEEWITEGIYFVPIQSRGITYPDPWKA